MSPEALKIASASVCLFFAILFIQSGQDKIFDWKGNLDWLKGHFAKSPLAKGVPLMLASVTVVECSAGLCSLLGAAGSFVDALRFFTTLGPLLALLALTMLFFGQRVAKDYPGAASLTTYYGVALVGYLVCSHSR